MPHRICALAAAALLSQTGGPIGAQGMAPVGSATPAEFGNYFRADFGRVGKIIRLAEIRPE